jgi:transposase
MHQAQILLQEGHFRNTVANILDVSRRTVYNYEHGLVFKKGTKQGRPKGKSKLAPYYDQINEALDKDFTLNAELLYVNPSKAGLYW